MKGGHKEGTKTKMQGKSTLLHWWTSATPLSTSASQRMFERAISSVEIIVCFMNLYICDLLFLMTVSKHETKARRSCTQTARWFLEMTTLTWMVRNIPNRYAVEEITEEIDEAGIRVEKSNIGTIINKMVGD